MTEAIEKNFTEFSPPEITRNEPLTVFQLLPGSESAEMSIALIVLNGKNRKVRNPASKARYMIVEGQGSFTLWNDTQRVTLHVQKGSSVTIPAGMWYQDEGRMIMVSINHPAFDQNKVEFDNQVS